MIQAPGMHGRAAAGHCTCSSEKQADGSMFGNSVHVCARVYCACIFSVCTSIFLALFLHPSSPFPALFAFLLFSPVSFPHFSSHTGSVRQIKISVRCSEELWTPGP